VIAYKKQHIKVDSCLLVSISAQKTLSQITSKSGEILYLPRLLFHLPNLNQVLLELIEGQGIGSGVDSGKKVDTVSHIGSKVFNYF